MRKLCLAATLLMLSIAAAAQGPPSVANSKLAAPLSTITSKVTGLTCQTPAGNSTFSVQAWSWGASNTSTVSGSGGGTGKANVGDLSLTKRFDECSPALFGAVVIGKHFTTMTLTQEDSNGNVVATVTLTDVLVSSWQLGSSTNDAAPSETISVNFGKVCIAEASGNKFCYDIAAAKTI